LRSEVARRSSAGPPNAGLTLGAAIARAAGVTKTLTAAAVCLGIGACVAWVAVSRERAVSRNEPASSSPEPSAPVVAAPLVVAPTAPASTPIAPSKTDVALGDPILDESSPTPTERQLLAELDGEPRLRALGHLIYAGYHHDRAGDAEKALEWRQFEDMKAHPKESLAAIRRALRAPSLGKPDTAYGRVSLLALAAQLPGQKEETKKLLRSEMTERIVPKAPALPAPHGRDDLLGRMQARPEVAPPAAAHDLYLQSASPADAFEATLLAIAAQPDRTVRQKLQAQYIALYPDMGDRLAREAAARGTPLPEPARPKFPELPSSEGTDQAAAQ
jgi:hypothetical protein